MTPYLSTCLDLAPFIALLCIACFRIGLAIGRRRPVRPTPAQRAWCSREMRLERLLKSEAHDAVFLSGVQYGREIDR